MRHGSGIVKIGHVYRTWELHEVKYTGAIYVYVVMWPMRDTS